MKPLFYENREHYSYRRSSKIVILKMVKQSKSSYIKIACKTVHIYSTLSKALGVYP